MRYAVVPLLCVAGCVSAPPPALVHESVFVGALTAVTLIPRDDDADAAAKTFPPTSATVKLPAGGAITIGNGCGLERDDVQVIETLAGPTLPREVRLTSILGEWCKPNLNVDRRPALLVVWAFDTESRRVSYDHYEIVRGIGGRSAVIVPVWTTTIGNVEVAPLLADLGFEYPLAPTSEVSPTMQAELKASGYVGERDGQLFYTKGVYLDAFRKALASNNRWRGP